MSVTKHMTQSEIDALFEEFIDLCAELGKYDQIRRYLSNPAYLQGKIVKQDPYALIRNFKYLAQEEAYQQIQTALEIAAPILAADPYQLPGQLLGRLGEKRLIRGNGRFFHFRETLQKHLSVRLPLNPQQAEPSPHQAFLTSVSRQTAFPWFQPLFASLNPPDSILLRRLRPHATNGFSDFVLLKESHTLIGLDQQRGAEQPYYLSRWDYVTGEQIGQPAQLSITSGYHHLTLSPDQKRLLIYHKNIYVWDMERWQLLEEYISSSERRLVRLTYATDHAFLVGADWSGILSIWNFSDGNVKGVVAHEGKIEDFKILPSNKAVVTVGEDKFVRLWDLATGNKLAEHQQHSERVIGVQVSEDGRWAKTVSDTQLIGVDQDNSTTLYWKLETYEVRQKVPTALRYTDAIATNDKKFEFRKTVPGVEIIDTLKQKRRNIFPAHASTITKMRLTTDDNYLITLSDDQNLFVWDVNVLLNAPDKVEQFGRLRPHHSNVTATAISSDGRIGVTGSWDGAVLVWEMATQTVRYRLRLLGERGVYAFAITPDDRMVIAGGNDGAMCGWDLETGDVLSVFGFRPTRQPYSHQERIKTLAVHPSPFSPLLASGSGNELFGFMGKSSGELKLWNYRTSVHLADAYADKELIKQVCFAPNGAFCVFGTGSPLTRNEATAKLFVINLSDTTIREMDLEFRAMGGMAFSQNGRFLSISRGSLFGGEAEKPIVAIWDTGLWEPVFQCMRHEYDGYIESLLFSHNGRYLIGGLKAADGNIQIWDLTQAVDGEVIPIGNLVGHIGDVNKILLTSDDRYLISVGNDQTIRLWNLAQQKQLAQFQMESRVLDISLSVDNRTILVGSADGRVHFFKFHPESNSELVSA